MTPEKNRSQAQSLMDSTPLMGEVMQDVLQYDAYLTTRMTNSTVILLDGGIAKKQKDTYQFKIVLKDCQLDREKTPQIEIKNGDARKVLLLMAMLNTCTIAINDESADNGYIREFRIYTKGEEVTGDEQVISFLELLGHVKRLLKIPQVDYLTGPTKNES
jgi:hypothetical protein